MKTASSLLIIINFFSFNILKAQTATSNLQLKYKLRGYTTDSIPCWDIKPTICNVNIGAVSKQQLLKKPIIEFDSTEINNLKVISFNFTLIQKGELPYDLKASQNFFTDEMIKAIENINPPFKIYLEYIKFQDANGIVGCAPAISLRL